MIVTAGENLMWWRARLDAPSFVYLVQGQPGMPIKIGVAKDVEARIASLQTGNPYRLHLLYVLPGSYELEWQLHQKVAAHRLEGEWFEAAAVEALFPWLSCLSVALARAYADDGHIPTYRQPGFTWKRAKSASAKEIVVRHVVPEPVAPEETQKRLAAAWMRPRWRGHEMPGGGRVGSLV